MLEWYHWTLIGLAIVAGLLACNVPRALFWLFLGAFSYITSAWWHNAGIPFGTLYGAGTNLFICWLLYRMAETRWEMGVFNCFIFMLLIDLLFVTDIIKSRETFAICLEVANAAAMLLIGATGILDRIGAARHDFRIWGSSVLRRCHRALFASRKEYPRWWRAP